MVKMIAVNDIFFQSNKYLFLYLIKVDGVEGHVMINPSHVPVQVRTHLIFIIHHTLLYLVYYFLLFLIHFVFQTRIAFKFFQFLSYDHSMKSFVFIIIFYSIRRHTYFFTIIFSFSSSYSFFLFFFSLFFCFCLSHASLISFPLFLRSEFLFSCSG